MATVPITDVYQAYLDAGFTDNQARALAAETGRETGFQSQFLFGTHADPANKATNFGLMSFQGNRRANILDFLRNEGRVNEQGQIIPGQETLVAQAKFIRNEMETNPAYARTREQFLNNPNVDPEKAAEVLGRNYIRWRYDDPKYASHHETRRSYLNQIPADGSAPRPSFLSPAPISGASTPSGSFTPTTPTYSNDVGTQLSLLGNWAFPSLVDKPQALSPEQAAQQLRTQAAAKSQLSQANDAMKAFQALQAYGASRAAANQQPSLLQPMFTRGQFQPIQMTRGLL